MWKKIIILSLIVLLAGLAVYGWVVYDQHKQHRFIEEQKNVNQLFQNSEIDQSNSVNPVLKSLVQASIDIHTQNSIESQLKNNETRDLLQTIAILLIVCSGGFLLVVVVDYLAKFIIKSGKILSNHLIYKLSKSKENKIKLQKIEKLYTPVEDSKIQELATKSFKVDGFEKVNQISSMKTLYSPANAANKSQSASATAVIQSKGKTNNINLEQQSQQLEETIKTHFSNLQTQIEEVRNIAKTSNQTDTDKKVVYESTLTELTKQVEAINDFAAQQQDKVKRLQEGYDWNIIKNFALRIIRCIDNIELTIKKMLEQGKDTTELEQTRDDFIFALESSGIEKFEPQIGSEYRGQEKLTEAMPDKIQADEADRKGRIAEIIRSGYTYEISEDNIKVVRNAQVKLYC